MEEIIEEPIEPTRFAQFETIEAYNAVNVAIIAYKDELTNGEYTRTNTLYAYNPEPEPNWDECYYMEALPIYISNGLFNDITIIDSIPIEINDEREL